MDSARIAESEYRRLPTAILVGLSCNKVQAEQGSSFDITDSTVLIRQTDESKTVDRSVQFSENVVSGPVTMGENVNVSNVVNIGSSNEQTVSPDEWKSLAEKMNALVESEGV